MSLQVFGGGDERDSIRFCLCPGRGSSLLRSPHIVQCISSSAKFIFDVVTCDRGSGNRGFRASQ